ncbi:class II glutamine amidotransferase [Anaeropeptidivorans aminofermentans]|uniref:class II glutamine amidotransferase n=1 Tax=Anaeropeptidivorans aminofermentans TaxID=2934315 RepID=UPI00202595CF|nr:class II glutamine amidotransferase [Anaeropeptidivorans aminofermentans]
MCGIFGYLNYGNCIKNEDLKDIIESLAYESAVRGIDATGVAFINSKSKLEIQKAPKPSYSFKMNFPKINPPVLIGHTRHTTQGTEKLNINNHPFLGGKGNNQFALAHNGILYNDKELRKENKLPDTKIQTDSYIAVQLLEQSGDISLMSVASMSEKIEGSFVFTVLDKYANLYISKKDNPISIIHHKGMKLYIYASTEKILMSALMKSNLINYFTPTEKNTGDIEFVELMDGEVVKIDNKGIDSKTTFKPKKTSILEWCEGGIDFRFYNDEDAYWQDLKNVAKFIGYDEEFIESLISEGFSADEIEDFIYGEINNDLSFRF